MSDPMSSFVVKELIPIHIAGIDLSITNSSIFMIFVTLLICVLFVSGASKKKLIPSKLQLIIEKSIFFIGGIVKTSAGQNSVLLFPYMLALFLFIMFGNVIGLFPFAFSFTSQIAVTIGMALIVFMSSIIIGLVKQGKHYFRHFCPEGIPGYLAPFVVVVELLSFMFRPISLGIRLFANMVAGHIMIDVIAGFAASMAGIAALSVCSVIPVTVNILLNCFKVVVCVLQAYVFVVLSCMYLSESFADSNH